MIVEILVYFDITAVTVKSLGLLLIWNVNYITFQWFAIGLFSKHTKNVIRMVIRDRGYLAFSV